MLKIENLEFDYEHKNKIQNYSYSLHVNSGEIVAIMGESGSGKSTLLDLIAGFLTPKSGKILFKGVEISKLEIQDRPISLLFQNYNTFEHLNVLKNVLLGINPSIKNSKEEIQKAKEVLSEVGLEKFENQVVSKLSGGQAQRVALARSLASNREILLLDEPFSALDYETKEKMLELVKNNAKKRALYTIFVTHDSKEARKIADKIYMLENGKLSVI